MLKRIQVLRNVGRFRNCKSGGVEFGKLTIIYGRNTYGKTTLADVFASISNGDGSLVAGRATIPHDDAPQHIKLGFLAPNDAKETSVTFQQGAWSEGLPTGLGMQTFDDGFLHDNVFAAREFNRTTKENFSAYVLGAQGVQQAKAVAEKKKARGRVTRDRNALKRDAFSGIDNLASFLKLSPIGTIDESVDNLHELRNQHNDIVKQQKQTQAIHDRKEGTYLGWADDFSKALTFINQTLAMGLEGTHKEAKAQVAKHIGEYFRQSVGAEQWIREGLKQNKGTSCQFCGQTLSVDALVLLQAYQQAFDAAFDQHDANVRKRLQSAMASLSRPRVDALRAAIAQNTAALAGYSELQGTQDYLSGCSKLAEVAAQLEVGLTKWSASLQSTVARLKMTTDAKQRSPHTSMKQVQEPEASALEASLLKLVSDYNMWIDVCNGEIQKFKQATNPSALQERLKTVVAAGKAEARNRDRIKLSAQCTKFMALAGEEDALDKAIPALEQTLRTTQSDYLKKFFNSLNVWFKKFGSKNFTLERGETTQGHTPIYFLKVKYGGVNIDERELKQVFSESDRRALALAIFWTQLQELPEIVRAQQIVVLDDPLTSFDDHRVTAVHGELARTVDSVRQIIVLSHYRHEIQLLLEKFRNNPDIRLLSLVADGVAGTALHCGDPQEFLLSEHEKARERLTAFAEGNTNDHSCGDLRIFFEHELHSRFAIQISQHDLAELQLGDKIDGLATNGLITHAIKKDCHNWRDNLNPSHHTWTTNDLEDQRNSVHDFLDFIYNKLIRAQ